MYEKQGCIVCNNPRIPVVGCTNFCSCRGKKHTHYQCRCGRRFIVMGE